jgi:uncharacterized membrane protein YeaQ/YmgE (transglycosylase-associated protein family)
MMAKESDAGSMASTIAPGSVRSARGIFLNITPGLERAIVADIVESD